MNAQEILRQGVSLRSCCYSRGDGSALPVESYCALWKLTEILRDGVTSADPAAPKLGDVHSFMKSLSSQSQTPGTLGGIAIGEDLQFENGGLTVWNRGLPTASSMIGVSRDVLRKTGFKPALSLLREHIKLSDESGAVYGLIDYSMERETEFGGTLGSVIHLDAPLRSIVEQSIWLQQGVRQKRVRGVYWGNYLSNELLEKLGGNLAEEYRAQAQNLNGDPTGLVWEFPNGTFVSISLDPTVGSPFGEDMIDIETFENLNWLVERFTESRLL